MGTVYRVEPFIGSATLGQRSCGIPMAMGGGTGDSEGPWGAIRECRMLLGGLKGQGCLYRSWYKQIQFILVGLLEKPKLFCSVKVKDR